MIDKHAAEPIRDRGVRYHAELIHVLNSLERDTGRSMLGLPTHLGGPLIFEVIVYQDFLSRSWCQINQMLLSSFVKKQLLDPSFKS